MRRLLDIDVLLDVAFQRPGEPVSTRLIGLYGTAHEAWVAWHTLATLAYLIERQLDAAEARSFVEGLLGWADVAPTTRADAVQAVALSIPDFVDALQAAAAMACGAQAIVTRNVRDFKGSPVPAMTPETFLRRFGVGGR